MSTPQWEVVDVGADCLTINDHGRTVALVSSQGYIDWLLRSPLESGPLLKSVRKETHLTYTLGLKLMLTPPTPACVMTHRTHAGSDHGAVLTLTGDSRSEDGKFVTQTVARFATDPGGARYRWNLRTTLRCTAREPVKLPWIEFNNVYPAKTGRCFLCAPHKRYTCTLLVDRQGTVWRYPHQHLMHYTPKINPRQFGPGTLGGFFGDPAGAPVVIVTRSSIEPDWGICDMYYDLHCGARVPGDQMIQPGQTFEFEYEVRYLPRAEADALLDRSVPVPVTAEDKAKHEYPRFELGMNSFLKVVEIDRLDDASGFRPRPPVKVWDREVGHRTKGSLRITNETAQETVWGAEPPSEIPAEHTLRITAMAKTEGVEGRGLFLRVRYHTFEWHPRPHVEWVKTLTSIPVTGTTAGWVRIEVPELRVPAKDFDYLIAFEVVLDGRGVGWVTDVDVDLQESPEPPPAMEEGSSQKQRRPARAKSRASAGATA